MLKRSHDRKVTNLTTKNGKQSAIKNTFGLPAGNAYSCPGATSACQSICYANRLERVYKGVRDVLIHNWNLLKDADYSTMVILIQDMITDFEKDCEKRSAPKLFRIHWDGDFFSEEYAKAWRTVILSTPQIQYWVYTRSSFAIPILKDIDNLSLYFSTDSVNLPLASTLRQEHGVRLAYLAENFAVGKEGIKAITGRPAAMCPENKKSIPLISEKGSACVSCGLCIFERSDILFSATKK